MLSQNPLVSQLSLPCFIIPPGIMKLLGGTLVSLCSSFPLSVRPSIRPAFRVHSVTPTVLDGFFPYYAQMNTCMRGCVTCNDLWPWLLSSRSFGHDFAIKLLKYITSCHVRSTACTVLDGFFLYLAQVSCVYDERQLLDGLHGVLSFKSHGHQHCHHVWLAHTYMETASGHIAVRAGARERANGWIHEWSVYCQMQRVMFRPCTLVLPIDIKNLYRLSNCLYRYISIYIGFLATIF